jgi:hypothetical protein
MKITARERTLVVGGGVLLAILLAGQMLISPAYQRIRDLQRLVPQKERELGEVRQLRKELEALQGRKNYLLQNIPPGERTLAPLAKLDGLIERCGLRAYIRSIRPTQGAAEAGEEMTVEVQAERVDLPQLTRFLYEVQAAPRGVRIARMGIKPRYTTPRYLDITLQMVFYRT